MVFFSVISIPHFNITKYNFVTIELLKSLYSHKIYTNHKLDMYIEKINAPEDLKILNIGQMELLSAEIRNTLLHKLSEHGGHIGPNLGLVEPTIALHYVFDSPIDKFVFDVSHQSYTHKILTGRKEGFLESEHYDDVSGYTNPDESEHDFFTVGHTSTSISLACGLARARDLKGKKGNVIAIIGDGSLSGGEAFEGLDDASTLNSNFIVIVNDNQMSIAENHGGLYANLKELRDTNGQSSCNYFKALGFDYRYINDGNNITELIKVLKEIKDIDHPTVVHINTLKGKGYSYAEKDKEKWHWNFPFYIENGESKVNFDDDDYSDIFAKFMLDKIKRDKSVAVITAGTPAVIGFDSKRRKEAGKQFVDVGICEEHAVAMASGMAANGGKPVFGVYSTFIQRAYDQLSQDLAINKNPAVINVFLGSLTGMTDVTHLGFFDIPLISNIPNIIYLAPTCKEEYLAMFEWSLSQRENPIAIRIPAQVVVSGKEYPKDYSNFNKFEMTKKGSKVAIVALGGFYQLGEEVSALLNSEYNIDATLINPRYISGIDTEILNSLKSDHELVITLEDGIIEGGFGQKIASFYGPSEMKVINFGGNKKFVDRYNIAEFLEENHLTPPQIVKDVVNAL